MEKEVFDFLKRLEKNNNRDWFKDHKSDFENAKNLANNLFNKMYVTISEIDELEPLKIFRIYKDVRFSADKTPYKTHFSAQMGRLKPHNRGGCYLQIQPGNSFLAIGFWEPNKEDLFRIRKEFELDDAFEKVLSNTTLKKVFPDLIGEELKTAPKGFDKMHERIHLIRKKQFLLIRNFSDEEVLNENFLSTIVKSYSAAKPFVTYFTNILTTNLNGESIFD